MSGLKSPQVRLSLNVSYGDLPTFYQRLKTPKEGLSVNVRCVDFSLRNLAFLSKINALNYI